MIPTRDRKKAKMASLSNEVHFDITRSDPQFQQRGVKNLGNTCFINASLPAMTTFHEFLAVEFKLPLTQLQPGVFVNTLMRILGLRR